MSAASSSPEREWRAARRRGSPSIAVGERDAGAAVLIGAGVCAPASAAARTSPAPIARSTAETAPASMRRSRSWRHVANASTQPTTVYSCRPTVASGSVGVPAVVVGVAHRDLQPVRPRPAGDGGAGPRCGRGRRRRRRPRRASVSPTTRLSGEAASVDRRCDRSMTTRRRPSAGRSLRSDERSMSTPPARLVPSGGAASPSRAARILPSGPGSAHVAAGRVDAPRPAGARRRRARATSTGAESGARRRIRRRTTGLARRVEDRAPARAERPVGQGERDVAVAAVEGEIERVVGDRLAVVADEPVGRHEDRRRRCRPRPASLGRHRRAIGVEPARCRAARPRPSAALEPAPPVEHRVRRAGSGRAGA